MVEIVTFCIAVAAARWWVLRSRERPKANLPESLPVEHVDVLCVPKEYGSSIVLRYTPETGTERRCPCGNWFTFSDDGRAYCSTACSPAGVLED